MRKFPECSQTQLLPGNKYFFHREAERHRQSAKNELSKAEQICWYIPDLGKRDHLKVLIASCLVSSSIPEARQKLVTVGLTLIGSMISDVIEQYFDLRSHLAKAAYHFEMYDFYNRLSLNLVEDKNLKLDEGSKAFLLAIDRLTLVEMLVRTIPENDRCAKAISEELISQKKLLHNQLNNPKWKLTGNLSEIGMTLYENINEIISDLEDEELQLSIPDYIYDMVQGLKTAERCWSTH